MHKILLVLYVLFGLVAGCFIGMGNHAGLIHAVLPGLIFGALLALPLLRDRSWRMAAVLIVCSLIGTFASTAFPEDGAVKRFCMDQTNLVIHAGSFRLGK